jgi:hypothetical protein
MKNETIIKIVTGAFVFLTIALFIAAPSTDNRESENQSENSYEKEPSNSKTTEDQPSSYLEEPVIENVVEEKPPTDLELIEKLVNDKYGGLEITIWSTTSEFANESNGPWEVIINSQLFAFSDCFGAKSLNYDIMKALYTNDQLKDKLIRVKTSFSDQFQASLGNVDASSIDKEMWDANGPSNFSRALEGSGTSENSNLTKDRQTYFSSINGNCTP